MLRPKDAFIAVTFRCNARCQMCNIWKSSPTTEMGPEHYRKLPDSLKGINITGGEPFLRKDLLEVVEAIHSAVPSARIVFSTNGLKTDTILDTIGNVLKFHRKVGVGVSIDGLEKTHDRIRGVPGAFRSAVSTIEGLVRIGVEDLRIGMTLVKDNVADARAVHDLSKKLGVEFSTTFAHNSEIYFRKTDNLPPEMVGDSARALLDIQGSQLRSSSVKDWYRAYHVQGVMDPNLRKEFVMQCKAGSRYFFMTPAGDVYPCMSMDLRIGNLSNVSSWKELFEPGIELKVRIAVKNCREDCWMVCNTRSHIVSHPFKSSWWVAKNKVSAHIRK